VSASEPYCSPSTTDTPPFWVSDEIKQGDKVWENLRNLEDDDKKKYYLPKGSIVHSPAELFGNDPAVAIRLPVKVLSVPKDDYEKTLAASQLISKGVLKVKRKLRIQTYGKKNLIRAERGATGFIDERSLMKVDKYTFMLKSDSPLFKNATGTPLNGHALTFKMQGDLFAIEQCCISPTNENFSNVNEDLEETCFNKYIFNITDEQGDSLGPASYNLSSCNIAEHLTAIPRTKYKSIEKVLNLAKESDGIDEHFHSLGIENIELFPKKNKWSGATRVNDPDIALIKFPINKITGEGPYNSFHYNRDDKVDSDALITPLAGCGFMQVLKTHNKACQTPGCTVMFGDIYHEASWGEHSQHGKGNCIDIRPFRLKDDFHINGLQYGWERYDQEKTRNFIKLLVKAGARPIHFNDPQLIKDFHGPAMKRELRPDLGDNWNLKRFPSKVPGHNNHIHACFPDNQEIEKLCREGL